MTKLSLLFFRLYFNKLFLKSKCIFATLEGIEICKPNIRSSPIATLTSYSWENFVHQVQISRKCTWRLKKYPNFRIKYQNINWSRRTGEVYSCIFKNYKDRDITTNTWRSSYQTQVKINTFMPDTKHQKHLKRSHPLIKSSCKKRQLA